MSPVVSIAVVFTLVLGGLMLWRGNNIAYTGLVMYFTILGAVTVQILGGLFNLLGASVFVLMLQNVVISQTAKTLFGERGDVNLIHPITTMTVYCTGITGLFLGAVLFKALGLNKVRPIVAPLEDLGRLRILAIVLTVFAVVREVLLQRLGVFEGGGVFVGGVVGPLRQLGFLTTLGVAAGTAHVILASNGKRCIGPLNLIAMIPAIVSGILSATRQEMALTVITFFLTLIAFRFKLRVLHYAAIGLVTYAFFFILSPYALYARAEGGVRYGNIDERLQKSFLGLLDVVANPGKYQAKSETHNYNDPWEFHRLSYYGKPNPLLDRYSMIVVVDAIIDGVIVRGNTGMTTITPGFEMLVPRFLNPNKAPLGTANYVAARGRGTMTASDQYTQPTVGFFSDAFLSFGMMGVLTISFLIGFGFYTVYSILINPNLHRNIFAASLMFVTVWVFSEATIQAQILNVLWWPLLFLGSVLPLIIFANSVTRRHVDGRFVFERRSMSDSATVG
ncbi:MAG: hypothetical protein KF884_06915 [Fimbriimonadaceae bacterium]|nr:hypothetical protein [Fimbriimonadaceae bacterium]QYK57280.1 MAG: hypothetical protein KF884_06915 [Fimbriimonadaceae bacterium]